MLFQSFSSTLLTASQLLGAERAHPRAHVLANNSLARFTTS